jgi:hypothetical protein
LRWVYSDTLALGERHQAGAVRIVAKGRCIADLHAGAGEIDSGVERVAAVGQAEPPVVAARQLHHALADRDNRCAACLEQGHGNVPLLVEGCDDGARDLRGRCLAAEVAREDAAFARHRLDGAHEAGTGLALAEMIEHQHG